MDMLTAFEKAVVTEEKYKTLTHVVIDLVNEGYSLKEIYICLGEFYHSLDLSTVTDVEEIVGIVLDEMAHLPRAGHDKWVDVLEDETGYDVEGKLIQLQPRPSTDT